MKMEVKVEENEVDEGNMLQHPSKKFSRRMSRQLSLLYKIDDNPSPLMTIALAMQHFLVMSTSTILVSMVVIEKLCMGNLLHVQSEIIGSVMFVMGIATILQSTMGVRLPIIQGSTASVLIPILALLDSQNIPSCPKNDTLNITSDHEEYNPQSVGGIRLRNVFGLIMVGSAFQIFLGLSGILSLLLKFIGPLTIAPVISLIGLCLFPIASSLASHHWWIAILTATLCILFTFYLDNAAIPFPFYSREKKFHWIKFYIFAKCPILLGVFVSWMISAILTACNVFPENPSSWGYLARSDSRIKALKVSRWFRVPYPFQYGTPLVTPTSILAVLSGYLCSVFESIGDYYAAAMASGAPPPPNFAVNRGITFEAIGCFLAGLFCSPVATTSYSDNIGVIGITKVGSRRVVQVAGLIMIIMGLFTKASAVFIAIPLPIVGGLFLTMFSMLTGIGISNIRLVNLSISRNVFVFGFSIFCGLAIPDWVSKNSEKIDLKSKLLTETVITLLQTQMFVGGIIAFIFDNTMPGSYKDRGILAWKKTVEDNSESPFIKNERRQHVLKIYNFFVYDKLFRKVRWMAYLPICPKYADNPIEENQL